MSRDIEEIVEVCQKKEEYQKNHRSFTEGNLFMDDVGKTQVFNDFLFQSSQIESAVR